MVSIAGSYEDQQESFKDLAMLMILILILVYIVMAAQFESFTSPFIIMFSVPFALTGVLAGLAVSGTALGIMSMVGLMMLFGIVVKRNRFDRLHCPVPRTRNVHHGGRCYFGPFPSASHPDDRHDHHFRHVTLAVGRGVGAEMWNGLGITVASGHDHLHAGYPFPDPRHLQPFGGEGR